jgi:hypothetical protein
MACINMQAALAFVPWTPMMAGTLTESVNLSEAPVAGIY